MIYHKMIRQVMCSLLVGSSLLLSACKDDNKTELKAPLRQVRSMLLFDGDGSYQQSFSGQLHALSEVSFSFKVSGTIDIIYVKVGDRVKQGDKLASLDASDYGLAVQQARASLIEAQERARNAKSNYDRVKKLYAAGNTSRNELDSTRSASGTAAAAAQVSRKTLEIAQKNLSYATLKADAGCAIASVDVDAGENVTAGKQIFFATCGNELEVKLNVPESSINYIKKDMLVEVMFSALGNNRYQGKVNEVGVSSVGGGTTFPVDILIIDADQKGLKAGLSADVKFDIKAKNNGNKQATIIVPPYAIAEDETGRFVFILQSTADGVATVRRQPVTLGNTLQSGIEVVDGLSSNMRVVTAGVSVLRDGMEVKYSDE